MDGCLPVTLIFHRVLEQGVETQKHSFNDQRDIEEFLTEIRALLLTQLLGLVQSFTSIH